MSGCRNLGRVSDRIGRAIMDEINAFVSDYGGLCSECDAVPPDYVPAFTPLFEKQPRPS